MDVMDETRESLTETLDPEGEYFIGAEIGDGSPAKFRGPTGAADAVNNAVLWAQAAFEGKELQVATADELPAPKEGQDPPEQTFTTVATLTAGGPGNAPKLSGTKAKAAAKKSTAKRASAK